MIRIDKVAAAHMRALGCDPEQWLLRLRRHEDGHLDDGRAWTTWRQLPDAPGGNWLSLMELVMIGHAGHVVFEPVQNREARYMQSREDGKEPRGAAVMLPGHLPEAIVVALTGRRLGDVVDFDPIQDARIIEAQNVSIATLRTTMISVEPELEVFETPFHLMGITQGYVPPNQPRSQKGLPS